MRLTDTEVMAIREAVREVDTQAQTYLFGSRTDDSKRGGDIDLLIVSGKMNAADRRRLKLRLYDRIGEQKIDVVLAHDLSRPFVRLARKEGLLL